MISGVLTALITPFNETGEVDLATYDRLVQWQINENINGLVVMGTTGESATLSHQEHKELIEHCVKMAKGRVPVVAGAGSNSTAEAIELAVHAEACKVDALLVVTPYYNKPSQRGLFAHFSAIAKSVKLPIIIYNIPSRSVIDILPETIRDLRKEHSNIIAIKDATGCLERVAQQRAICGKDFIQLSGNDATVVAFNAQGGSGAISVTSNVAPRLCSQLHAACASGDYATALAINDKLASLNQALFIEPNPAGIKYALSKLGFGNGKLRLPMVELQQSTKDIIDSALAEAGLI